MARYSVAIDAAGTHGLTRREQQVLRLLAEGLATSEIASELRVHAGTIRSHIDVLRRKLGASGRTQAVVIALERGILAAVSEDE